MKDPKQTLALLNEEFERWKEILASLSEEQATTSRLPNGWSIKDLTAHLMAWQQISVARLEAAQRDEEPVFPGWLAGADPDAEDVDPINARIDETYRGASWSQVHQAWRDGFIRLLTLAKEISEGDLEDTQKYPWLKGYSLFDVLQGTYEHHHEDHLQPLLTWVDEHENVQK